MNQTSAQSKGKVIISGEHSVVYGQPALVGSIHLFREAVLRPSKRQIRQAKFIQNVFRIFEEHAGVEVGNLQVTDLGRLPVGSGLGSSAAFAHAIFLALLKHFDLRATREELYEMVQESEKFAHGNPSGVDATAIVYGGLLEFSRGDGSVNINPIKVERGNFTNSDFYLIDSGRPSENTKQMVELVAKQLEEHPEVMRRLQRIGQLTSELIEDVRQDRFNAQLLMENQRLLEELGVVGDKANAMITLIENSGGYAKITGAGGVKTGSGMLLASATDPEKLEDLIRKQNWKFYKVKIG